LALVGSYIRRAVQEVAVYPSQQLGYIVAVMTKGPYQALVRWTHVEPTFESLDDLIEAAP